MQPLSLLGPLDALGTDVKYVVFGLALVNLGTRWLAHRQHVRQAAEAEGDEAMSRYLPHEATNVLLVLASLYMTTVAYHAGVVMSVLVFGLVITDFFEYEARRVEAREGWDLEQPKGAIAASGLVVAYGAFQVLFFLVEGIWNAIV